MLRWERQGSLSEAERAAVLDLLARTEQAVGREPIDETTRRHVAHGHRGEHWLRREDGGLTAYAFASQRVPPLVEAAGGGLDCALRDALLACHPSAEIWLRGDAPACDEAAVPLRILAFQTAPLPLPVVDLPKGFTVRPFQVGQDETAWLRLNNLAFQGHSEQGGWSCEDLVACEREPWFDPSVFLLLERDEQLAASAWMRVHDRPFGRYGELRVLSVHPDFRGLRLGEVAVTHGFEALRRQGLSRATLYVDAANAPAHALYGRLGFTTERLDRLVRIKR